MSLKRSNESFKKSVESMSKVKGLLWKGNIGKRMVKDMIGQLKKVKTAS